MCYYINGVGTITCLFGDGGVKSNPKIHAHGIYFLYIV